MELQLYYSPGACSLAPHIILRELGLPFGLKRVSVAADENQQPDYLRTNPRGLIPTLSVDGRSIRETSAILTWLGQSDGRFFPARGSVEAAVCSEWLAWLASDAHISVTMIWCGERYARYEHEHTALRRQGLRRLRAQFQEIEDALKGRQYLVGDAYTVADPYLFVFYRWGVRMNFDMGALFPAWTAHSELLLRRPAVVDALKCEEIKAYPDERDPRTAGIPAGEMTLEALSRFGDAWASHDTETLLSMMDGDAVYSASVGHEPGQTFRGKSELRNGFDSMLKTDQGGKRGAGPCWILGDVGVALWDFEFPAEGGKPAVKVRGIDLFEFRGDKILRKDAFRKTTEARPKRY